MLAYIELLEPKSKSIFASYFEKSSAKDTDPISRIPFRKGMPLQKVQRNFDYSLKKEATNKNWL